MGSEMPYDLSSILIIQYGIEYSVPEVSANVHASRPLRSWSESAVFPSPALGAARAALVPFTDAPARVVCPAPITRSISTSRDTRLQERVGTSAGTTESIRLFHRPGVWTVIERTFPRRSSRRSIAFGGGFRRTSRPSM